MLKCQTITVLYQYGETCYIEKPSALNSVCLPFKNFQASFYERLPGIPFQYFDIKLSNSLNTLCTSLL